MESVSYTPIGIIHSPFKKPAGTPIQPHGAVRGTGTVELFPRYTEGLKDIEGFSHIILIYHFHLAKQPTLTAQPFMDHIPRGIFSIRAPSRPNPIGISTVRLVAVDENVLHIEDMDIVDGTPLLDIKPYVPAFDHREVDAIGWLEESVDKMPQTTDNGRFTSP